MSHLLSSDSSVSVNTTPVESHVTAAAQATIRSHGVLQLLTAQMSVSVSVRVLLHLMCKQNHTVLAP